ncbi:MAG: hypothetical protein AAGC64_09240 [Bacteroidota bacterium]
MKFNLSLVFLLFSLMAFDQVPLYEYRDIKKSLKLPEKINSDRSVVIVHVPDEVGEIRCVGNWQKLSQRAHKAFITMKIDVVMYLNHYDLVVSDNTRESYAKLFTERNIENIIFLSQKDDSFQLLIAPFNNNSSFINSGEELFFSEHTQLEQVLFKTGKEIKRIGHEVENFLIPDKPNFVSGISIVEKSLLKNYPGILRRSKLSVEQLTKLDIPASTSEDTAIKIAAYNREIESKRLLLDSLMKAYPYEYEIIEPTSDEDLLRQRRQFVLRSISGQAKTLREMLDYNVSPDETDFVSIIPIMPDQTRAKPIPKNALVHKFYIKQNISKNIHVGEWDADTSWEQALQNMIGNLIQEHNVDRR